MSREREYHEHPSSYDLRAAAFGWIPEREETIRAHAAHCRRCRLALAADEEVRYLLSLLQEDEDDGEPPLAVAQEVLRRIERRKQERVRRRVVALRLVGLVAAILLAMTGTLVVAPGGLQAARWFQKILVREVPPPGQPGAPPAQIAPSTQGGGPIRRVSLEEARRLASFPVALPRDVPVGFALADVTVFQRGEGPIQVFVYYRRPESYQPLVLTYQAPTTAGEARAASGATQELLVRGSRGEYIDALPEGIRAADGSGPVAEIGRLIVERRDVIITATGDRRDGLDAASLAAIIASIP